MNTLATTDHDSVMQLWEMCSTAYLRHGKHISFPKGTDPAKTYQWRYLVKICQQLQQWEFDADSSRRLIEIAVDHAHRKQLTAKGLSILCQGNLLTICYQQLQQEWQQTTDTMEGLDQTHQWVSAHLGSGGAEQLLRRPHSRAYCQLVNWYQQRNLTDLYLALSRRCGQALTRLEQVAAAERAQLPSTTTLYLLRQQLHTDLHRSRQARLILGDDCKCK